MTDQTAPTLEQLRAIVGEGFSQWDHNEQHEALAAAVIVLRLKPGAGESAILAQQLLRDELTEALRFNSRLDDPLYAPMVALYNGLTGYIAATGYTQENEEWIPRRRPAE